MEPVFAKASADPQRSSGARARPRLSIIVPVFNEERTLAQTIERLHRHCDFAQIVFVNDGSRDRSLSILHTLARPQDLVLTKENGGKGSALRLAIPHCTGTYTIVQDADLEYDPADIPSLLQRAERERLPVLYGSRRLRRETLRSERYSYYTYYVGGNLLSSLTNLLFHTHLTDVMTCYKLIDTELLKSLRLRTDDFRIEVEITALLALRSVAITEVPISYHPRTKEEGKKIGWRDFLCCLGELLRARRSPSL